MAAELEPGQVAVDEAVSPETGQTTGDQQQERQPKQQKTPKVITEEDFRKFQAVKDREVAQAQRQAQQLQQHLAQLEAQMHQLSIRDLPEEEQAAARLQRQLQQAEQRAAAAENYARQMEAMQQIRQEWMTISTETGMPMEDIETMYNEGRDAKAIWAAAVRYVKDGRHNRRRDEDDEDDDRSAKAQRNRTDLGAGKGKESADFDTLLRKARESGSAVSLAKLAIQESLKQQRDSSR